MHRLCIFPNGREAMRYLAGAVRYAMNIGRHASYWFGLFVQPALVTLHASPSFAVMQLHYIPKRASPANSTYSTCLHTATTFHRTELFSSPHARHSPRQRLILGKENLAHGADTWRKAPATRHFWRPCATHKSTKLPTIL